MRAWQTTATGRPKDVLRLEDGVASPVPTPGTVHVAVTAAGIGLPDAFMCQGKYALTPSSFPFTQGEEVVGRVIGWGDGVENRHVGDRVMAVTSFFTGDGGYAEECLALDDFCLEAPDELTDVEAAGFLIAFHTAYIALVERAELAAGETLLVIGGAGGVGQAAIQIGKALGARVIATAGGAQKAEFCRALGADHVVDYHAEDIAEAVRAATGGRGADAIFDPVGGNAFESAMNCVAHAGRILAIGYASGSWGQVDTAHMVYNNYSVVGVVPSQYDRAFKERAQARMLGWRREGRLRAPIDGVIDFEALPDALERVLVGGEGGVKGRLVLAVDPAATRPD